LQWYNADLHIHSVLSPCGDLEMSPTNLMKEARSKSIDIISITDHNSFANSPAYAEAAHDFGINYIYGAEIQSSEEIHILAFFASWESANKFDLKLHSALLPVKNDPDFFGDQVVIDREGNILRYENTALINSTAWSFEQVFDEVEQSGGFAYPAHIDATSYSVISQLGFIPRDRKFIAVGITANCDTKKLVQNYPELKKLTLIRSSDAHYLKDIGSGITRFFLKKPELQEIVLACRNYEDREILT